MDSLLPKEVFHLIDLKSPIQSQLVFIFFATSLGEGDEVSDVLQCLGM